MVQYCKQPDRDCPKLECGYPLPCPYHTVIIENGTVTIPEELLTVVTPNILKHTIEVAKII